MSDVFALVIEGLDNLADLKDLPDQMIKAARIAVNDAATRGRTAMGKEVLSQVNLPSSYVSPKGNRLYVSKQATNATLEAVITARSRPTSLARFVQGVPSKGQRGLRVEVKKGAVRKLPGERAEKEGYSAFLVNLRSGQTDTKNNKGLAMRVPSGMRPPKAYKPKLLGKNLYLLYGPSVSQIIHGATTGKGVATDLTPDILDMLSNEFWRQMELK